MGNLFNRKKPDVPFYIKIVYDKKRFKKKEWRNGNYIGELGCNDRLIKNRTKETTRRPAFRRGVKGTAPLRDCAPYPLIYGFDDFEMLL